MSLQSVLASIRDVEEILGGYRVVDAEGKPLAYVDGLDPKELPAAGHLRPKRDEARRVSLNSAKRPKLSTRLNHE